MRADGAAALSACPLDPEGLMRLILGYAPRRKLAADCGAGLGETAAWLAAFFSKVIAVDSDRAIRPHALERANLRWHFGPAERLPLESGRADLVFSMQALHQFDRGAFVAEAARVLRPNGVFAALCWGRHQAPSLIDEAYGELYSAVAGFWEEGYKLAKTGYANVQLPGFEEIRIPPASRTAQMSQRDFEAYLASWSASRAYILHHGGLPWPRNASHAFGPHDRITVAWPLHGRVARKIESP